MAGNARLSIAEMERVIDRGGSILHNGRIIVDKRHLPRPIEIVTSQEDRDTLRRDLMRKKAEAEADLVALDGPGHRPQVGPVGGETTTPAHPGAAPPAANPDQPPPAPQAGEFAPAAPDAGPTDRAETGEGKSKKK